ncbi:MAG TPA: hypothetical protein VFC18_22405 [Burkholderiales bacterium]|nr:hypothetical protein [Burkholderiales bacterium]
MPTSVLLVVAGLACLAMCGLMFWKLMPQEGKEPSPWVGTDTRGTVVAMSLLMFLLAGVGLVLKGIL